MSNQTVNAPTPAEVAAQAAADKAAADAAAKSAPTAAEIATADKAKADKDKKAHALQYRVLHNLVGSHTKGEVVTFNDDVDLDRLLGLGAIEAV